MSLVINILLGLPRSFPTQQAAFSAEDPRGEDLSEICHQKVHSWVLGVYGKGGMEQ